MTFAILLLAFLAVVVVLIASAQRLRGHDPRDSRNDYSGYGATDVDNDRREDFSDNASDDAGASDSGGSDSGGGDGGGGGSD